MTEARTVIAVGVVTRRRPAMLSALADSLCAMDLPEDAAIRFVLVENDDRLSIRETADRLARESGLPVHCSHEPRPGIPFARNAALDVALAHESDFLVFLDDDEVVARDWLVRLWNGFRAADVELATGPVTPRKGIDDPLSPVQERILEGLRARAEREARAAERLLGEGRGGEIAAPTNNWICDLGFVRDKGLRFDERLGLSNGSDIKFWLDLKAAGGRSSRIADAIVYETVPASRLTLGYQVARNRDQMRASWRNRGRSTGPGALLRALPFIAYKAVLGTAFLVLGLADRGGRLSIQGARALGAAAGRLDAVRGRASTHYSTIHGG